MVRATIRDVARRAGVSTATVSYVLNDVENSRISSQTAERVRKTAAELGFQPNTHARNLVMNETGTICVVMPRSTTDSLAQPYFTQLLRAVSREAEDAGFHLLLAGLGSGRDAGVKKLLGQRVSERFLVVGTGFHEESLRWVVRHGARLAAINNQHFDEPGAFSACVDNETGAYMAVKHLLNLGHTDIAIICAGADEEDLGQRLSGYRQALQGAGLPVREELVAWCDETLADLGSQVGRLMGLPRRPSAVFATTDYLAVRLMPVLKAAGLCIPRDVALVGFDDADMAAWQDPPLTTIRQPIEEMGRAAARFLIDRAAGRSGRLLFPVELVVRGSCGLK